jgi:ATP-dependent DNA ligase
VTDYKTQKIYDSTAHKELFVGSLRVLLGSTSAREGCGEALTAEKMKNCVWVQPKLVARIEFLEWTDADNLRHSKFASLRDDKEPRKVVKES